MTAPNGDAITNRSRKISIDSAKCGPQSQITIRSINRIRGSRWPIRIGWPTEYVCRPVQSPVQPILQMIYVHVRQSNSVSWFEGLAQGVAR